MVSATPPDAGSLPDVTVLPRLDRRVRADLPNALTPLIGRERDIENLSAMLRRSEARLVTVSGPGGVGKTRLALDVARTVVNEFADGGRFVPLGTVFDPGLVAATVAHALAVSEQGDRRALERLTDLLRERKLLLVLDNLEQVIEAAPLATDLLTACPHLTVLVTSRSRLRISGEHEYVLAPLALPDLDHLPATTELAKTAAVRLFVERAQAAATGFAITDENAPLVAEICHRLDGLPLALELAAAWSKMLPPAALLGRLRHRLQVLTGGPGDAPNRLQTMRDAIAWSYGLLDAAEQTLFHRLAVFAGAFTLDAAEAIMGHGQDAPPGPKPFPPSPNFFDLVASLVDKSLLRTVLPGGAMQSVLSPPLSGQSSVLGPRFGMLETVRDYALERLAASGEENAVRLGHARWYEEFAKQTLTFPLRSVRPDALDRLEAELGNLRAALAWLEETRDAAALARLAGVLAPFWSMRSHRIEGRRWLERGLALAQSDAIATELRAMALHGLASLARTQDDTARAVEAAEAALALYRDLDDARNTAVVLNLLGALARAQGAYERAAPLFEESLRLFRELEEPHWVAMASGNLGILAHWQDDSSRDATLLLEALNLYRELGDPWGVGIALSDLALVTGDHGDFAEAAGMHVESLTQLRKLGVKEALIDALARIATLAVACDRDETGARLLGAAEALGQALGYTVERPERDRSQRAIANARRALGETPFARAWAAGEGLDLDRAVTVAAETAVRIAGAKVPLGESVVETDDFGASGSERPAGRLTPREREVLRLLVEGYSDRDIALALFISRKTASKHVAAILTKLGVTTRTAAATRAIRDGLV